MASAMTEGRMVFDFSQAVSAEKLDARSVRQPYHISIADFLVDVGSERWIVEVKDPAHPGATQAGSTAWHRAAAGQQNTKQGLLNHMLLKARDSYTLLHLLGEDQKPFLFVCVVEIAHPGFHAEFARSLRPLLRQEVDRPWTRVYVRDCVVIDVAGWNSDPDLGKYPVSVI